MHKQNYSVLTSHSWHKAGWEPRGGTSILWGDWQHQTQPSRTASSASASLLLCVQKWAKWWLNLLTMSELYIGGQCSEEAGGNRANRQLEKALSFPRENCRSCPASGPPSLGNLTCLSPECWACYVCPCLEGKQEEWWLPKMGWWLASDPRLAW